MFSSRIRNVKEWGSVPLNALSRQVAPSDSRAESTDVLTADEIEQLAPYLDLSQAKPTQIAPGVEHPAYGNSTEEVWFAYRGNLYEVVADGKIGALLRSNASTVSVCSNARAVIADSARRTGPRG